MPRPFSLHPRIATATGLLYLSAKTGNDAVVSGPRILSGRAEWPWR